MSRPLAAFQRLVNAPRISGIWTALKRPLLLAFLAGCMVSLVTSQRLTLRLVAGGTINACIILLAQIAVLAAVFRRNRTISFSQSIDIFFAGFGPWSLWMICFSTVWAFASVDDAFLWAGPRTILFSAGFVALWSAYIDFCFFRSVLHRTPARAAWDLLLQRAISWIIAILIFGAGPLVPELKRILAR